MWMNFTSTILAKRSKTQTSTYCMSSFIVYTKTEQFVLLKIRTVAAGSVGDGGSAGGRGSARSYQKGGWRGF